MPTLRQIPIYSSVDTSPAAKQQQLLAESEFMSCCSYIGSPTTITDIITFGLSPAPTLPQLKPAEGVATVLAAVETNARDCKQTPGGPAPPGVQSLADFSHHSFPSLHHGGGTVFLEETPAGERRVLGVGNNPYRSMARAILPPISMGGRSQQLQHHAKSGGAQTIPLSSNCGAAISIKKTAVSSSSPTSPFETYFVLLMKFRAEYGHCNCTKNLASSSPGSSHDYFFLSKWCDHIRDAHVNYLRLLDQGIKNPPLGILESEINISRLKMARFNFFKQTIFDEHFEELMIFQSRHGHCDVPSPNSTLNPKMLRLARWCAKVRRTYKYMMREQGISEQTKKSSKMVVLLKEHVERLENAGFDWENNVRRKYGYENWLKQLLEFKNKHGHCNVPRTPRTALGNWVIKVRVSYEEYYLLGKKPTNKKLPILTAENIRRLKNEGFNFIADRKYFWY